MEKASPLIEFDSRTWPNFTFNGWDSVQPMLTDGWHMLTVPFPLAYISIPIHRIDDPNPDFIREVETWGCLFFRWK